MKKQIRSNELKISYLQSNVFYDTDMLLLHFSFELLVKFVEKELPNDNRNWEENEETRRAKQTIDDLYNWWIPYREGDITLTLEQYELECNYLHRLIDVRKYLWT